MKKLTQDEYEHYKRQSYWTYFECISIMLGIHIDSIIDGKNIINLDRENPHHKTLVIQIKELMQTMDRSLEVDLRPREDIYTYSQIGADEPTFTPKHFLAWARKKEFQIPKELGFYNTEKADSEIIKNDNGGKKLRPDQQDKIECQRIASQIWNKYPILDIVHLTKHPEIMEIAGFKNTLYKKDTIHKWLSEIAPENAKKPGKRPKERREEQKKICEKIGIKI